MSRNSIATVSSSAFCGTALTVLQIKENELTEVRLVQLLLKCMSWKFKLIKGFFYNLYGYVFLKLAYKAIKTIFGLMFSYIYIYSHKLVLRTVLTLPAKIATLNWQCVYDTNSSLNLLVFVNLLVCRFLTSSVCQIRYRHWMSVITRSHN